MAAGPAREGSRRAVIELDGEDVRLRFPAGDFTDTLIRDLVASRRGSTAGTVRINPWSADRIAAWRTDDERWRKYGTHIAAVIVRAGRSVHGDGFVQRGARRLAVPLAPPPKSSTLVDGCMIDGAGWL